jgi:hypothetical protein
MNREQRRRLKKRNQKIRFIDYDLSNYGNGKEWRDISNSSEINAKKFKRLFKEYKFDLHKQFAHFDNRMKKHNVDYESAWIDKEIYIMLHCFLEMQKFRNRLSYEQVFEIFEMLLLKVSPINKRVLYMHCSVCFDFLSVPLQQKLSEIKIAILDSKDYEEDEFYERYELYKAFINDEELVDNANLEIEFAEKIEKQKKIVKRILNSQIKSVFESESDFDAYYNDDDFVEVYRGFSVVGDDKVRMLDEYKRHERNALILKEKDDEQLFYYNLAQYTGRGVSYSFDKNVALAFAFRSMDALRHCSRDKRVRACVGKFKVHKKDIFAFDNSRSEREIVVRSFDELVSPTFLLHYEFFTNESGEYNETGLYKKPNFRQQHLQSLEEYAKVYENTKIDKVFN